MENIVNRQIEMISVCAADGALTPIRFRMEDGEHMLRTVPIRQVVCSRPISYAGVEAIQYLCKTQLGQQEAVKMPSSPRNRSRSSRPSNTSMSTMRPPQWGHVSSRARPMRTGDFSLVVPLTIG